MAASCNVSKNPPSKLNFLASVKIPVGYRLVNPPEYNLYLTLDSTNLKTDTVFEFVDSIIVIERDATGNPTRTLPCSSKVARVTVHGTIYYNLVISKFQTAQSLDAAEFTGFSSNDVVPVNITLGYACAECDFPSDALYGFKVDITKLDEFVTTHSGTQIFYNPQSPDEFYAALAEPNDSEVIQVPYTITITSVGPND